MKRSTVVSLMMLGTAGIAAYALSGKTNAPGADTADANVFKSVDDCLTSRDLDPTACRAAHENASQTHAQSAPRFEDKADCEKQYGAAQCTGTLRPNSTGGFSTYFIPAMVGYAVARSLGRGGSPQPAAAQPLYNCAPGQARPDGTCYATRSGSSFFASSSRSSSGTTASQPQTSPTRTKVPTQAFTSVGGAAPVVSRGGSLSQTVSRGGFGRTGSAFSSSSS
jgi:uncharacterized protein YgiB involved in biofilm formation